MTEQTQSTDLQPAGNQATSSWKDGVERELRFSKDGNDRLSRFDNNDATVLATSYLRLENSQNDRVAIPTEDSSAEEKSAFFKKTGRPETAEGYTLPAMAEGQEIDKDIFAGWATIAHESGMSDAQFTALAKKYIELDTQQRETELTEFNRYREESDRKLHEDYGADYDKNIELSKRAYTEYANDDLKELLETDKFIGLRNEPSFIDMMFQIGNKNMDDTFVKGEGLPGSKVPDDFVPSSPNSPEMYANGDDEYSVKARTYFVKKGHVY